MKSKLPTLLSVGLVVLVVVATGSILMLRSKAAGNFVVANPEVGAITNPAALITDTTAANGAAVKFGQAPTAGSVFTIVNMPDTQRDINSLANVTGFDRFKNRFSWLVANRTALNLQLVLQAGDLQDWDTPDHFQFTRASAGIKIMEDAKLPFALTIGNHDTNAVCPGGSSCPGADTHTELRNTKTWNSFYPASRFPGITTYEAGKTDNAYRTYTFGGLDWMVVNLEFLPRVGAVNWAKAVVAAHPKHNVIILTHGYLDGVGGITQTNSNYGDSSPQYVFDNLISQYSNIRFVFSGHTGNADFRTDVGLNGNTIYSFQDCYHDTTNNWSRLLTFDTTKNTITTKVYAPWTNQTRPDAKSNVSLSNVSWVR